MALNPPVKFERYVHKDYPKMLYPRPEMFPHKGITVKTPEEEAAVLAQYDAPEPELESEVSAAASCPLPPVDTGERVFLVNLLTTLGAAFDPSDTVENLRTHVQAFAQPAAAAEVPAEAPEPEQPAEDPPVE